MHHCQGCYVKDAASDGTDQRPGLSVELHPTGTVESAKRMVAAQARHRQRKQRARPVASRA